jgi:hypothetical protein
MKLQISLMPRCPRADTRITQMTDAGSPDSISSIVNNPGSAHMPRRSQLTQFSSPALHGAMPWRCLFRGSESKRMDDHQKYLLALCAIHAHRLVSLAHKE